MAHQRGRSSAAFGVSLLLHVGVAIDVMALVQIAAPTRRPTVPPSRTRFVFAARVELDLPRTMLSPPRSTLNEESTRPQEAKPRLEVAPLPEPSARRIEPEPLSPGPVHVTPARAEPVTAKRPPAIVGVFPATRVTARDVEPLRHIDIAGFDTVEAKARELTSSAQLVGAFDQPGDANARSRPERVGIARAGFDDSPPIGAASVPTPRVVSDIGFGGALGQAKTRVPESPRPRVRDSGFDVQIEQPKTATAPGTRRIDIPIEVVFKPTPKYTDEARALKLEGEVLLEVEFAASNEVRVLRVVRGLGHGLDEAAMHAAQRIQFKPAQSGGRPVDFRTTVHIVFRLA